MKIETLIRYNLHKSLSLNIQILEGVEGGGGGIGVRFGEVAGDCSTKPNDRKKHNITVSQTKMFRRLHLLVTLNSCASIRGINFTCLSREHGTPSGGSSATILDHLFFSTALCTTCELNEIAQHMEPTLWHLRSLRRRR